MSTDRIHRTTSADGTEIAGRVVGDGPPLVLLHGGLGCGETAFVELLPHLTGHCTCFLPSTRGRGLSADSGDLTGERVFEDVLAFLVSIGEPVPVFGHSSGGLLTLAAAAFSDAVSSVIAYEPAVFDVAGEELLRDWADTIPPMRAYVDQGRPAEGARQFMALVYNDEEMEAADAAGLPDLCAPNVPADLGICEHLDPAAGVSLTAPDLLATIAVPVLLLQGTRTQPWFVGGNQHVATHVPDAEIRLIPGAGHGGPQLRPEPIATELVRFLQRRAPAPA